MTNTQTHSRLDPEITKELEEAGRETQEVVYEQVPKPKSKARSDAAKATQARLRKEREQQKSLAEQRRARYEQQESKRAVRPQADQNGTLYLLIALGSIMFLSAAGITAAGTIDVATASMGLPFDWMGGAVFGAIEVSILVFLLTYIIKGSRGETAYQWFAAMIFSSAVTIAAQVYHVARVHEFDTSSPDLWAGSALSVVVALGFILVSKAVASVTFAKTLTDADH